MNKKILNNYLIFNKIKKIAIRQIYFNNSKFCDNDIFRHVRQNYFNKKNFKNENNSLNFQQTKKNSIIAEIFHKKSNDERFR